MSGLMGAIGRGLSSAGYAAGDYYAKSALMDQQNEAETQRMMRLAEFKEAMEGRARASQVQRIDAKAGEMADEAVAGRRGLIDSGIADRESWTAEQQAAVDQSLALDKKAIVGDARVRERAAVATGDIGPKDAAAIDRDERKLAFGERSLAQKERMDIEREDRRDARAQASEEARDRRQMTALQAAEERARRLEGGKPPSGYRWKQDGSLEAIPGGPATVGKALPTKLVGDLGDQAGIADSTERFKSTFKPEFAGKTVMGDLSNTVKRVAGDDSGQSQWWQDYALHESTIRNKLFGASLTPGEQNQWMKLTVTPRMDANQVRQNLDRRAEIEGRALDRMMNAAAAGGYNKEQIEAVTGRSIPGGSGAQPAPGGATGEWGGKPASPALIDDLLKKYGGK